MQGTHSAPLDVLIVEGDRPLRADLRLVLEENGFTCAEAADGKEAVEAAQRLQPRCLLLDLAIHDMDGISVARRLRADPRTRGIRIHCLTGCADPTARAQVLEVGCESYLTKPVGVDEVLGVLRQSTSPRMGWISGLTLGEAQDLLDWLERQSCTHLEVCRQDDRFAVRCICPAGSRLVRSQNGEVRLVKE